MQPRLLAAGLAALALAGCQVPPSAARQCDFAKLIEFRLPADNSTPFIPIVLNNHRMMIEMDTGSDATSISEETALALGLKVDPTSKTEALDITGARTQGHLAPLQDTSLAPGYPMSGKIIVSGHFRAPSHPITGLLGRDVLGKFDLDLDMPHHRVSFYRPRSCPQVKPDLGGLTTELPQIHPATGRKTPVNMVLVELDGVAHYAMIDTGASYSVIDRNRAEMLGGAATVDIGDATEPTQTPSGKVVANRIHQFHTLRVGDEITEAPKLRISDLPDIDHSGNNQMLLGVDYLRHHRVWISFAGAAVYVSRWQEIESAR